MKDITLALPELTLSGLPFVPFVRIGLMRAMIASGLFGTIGFCGPDELSRHIFARLTIRSFAQAPEFAILPCRQIVTDLRMANRSAVILFRLDDA